MQDLTFGEQVKIVLSRKNMTIKELAKKIELRTKKKMSRQNLTQRLGRDNFQEQDMRMIAEILGCSFHLDILGDSAAAGKTGEEDVPAAGNGEKKEPAEKLTEGSAADRAEEQIVEELPEPERTGGKDAGGEARDAGGKAAAGGEAGDAGGKTAAGGETGDAGSKEASGRAGDRSGKDTDEKAPAVKERDITIGELVDIHEELDAMMEKAASGALEHREPKPAEQGQELAEYEDAHTHTRERAGYDNADVHDQSYAGYDDADMHGQSHAGYDDADVHGQSYTGYGGEDTDIQRQARYDDADVHIQAVPDEAAEGEPVEKLLEEIESMERENRKEEPAEERQESREKPHGWRTYFMQRLKRRGKEQPGNGDEGHADKNAAAEAAGQMPAAGYQTAGPEESTYAVTGYRTEYGPMGACAEDAGADYPEGDYAEDGYSESGYAKDTLDVMNEEAAYAEEEYMQTPQEDEDIGEYNPYTGKEYESNSVRMHPSRIGYVQVYDRSNHQWTDMTEWAFLGYQERKKQLLGKDYDPPIYLD